MRKQLALAGTLFLTALVYAPALGFDFVADDHALIVNNPAIRSWKFIPSYFVSDIWHSVNPHAAGTYYRPVLNLWLLLNSELFGANSWFWHLTTLGLHLCCTLLVYLLARKLTKDDYISTAAALLFGLHPVNIESAVWALGGNEPLVSAFLISSFLCYFSSRDTNLDPKTSRRWLTASLILYGIALFAKETAVLGCGLIFAYEWLFATSATPQPEGFRGYPQRFAKAFHRATPYLLLAMIYVCMRLIALRGLGAPRNTLSFLANLLTLPSVLAGYVKLLIWPVQMSPFYDYPFITAFSISKVLAPAIAVSAVAAGLFWLSNRSRLLAFACVWLVAPLAVLVDLRVFSEGAIFRMHWMYLPCIGFSLLCAAGLRALRSPTARALALAVVAVFLGYEAKSQSHYWATDWEVARRGIEVAPENHLVEFAMASELQRIGLAAEAIPYLKKALSHGQNYRSLVLLGECYEKLQMYSEAERCERAAIAADPHDPAPRLELGLIEERQQHLAQAESWIREALRLQVPERPELHEALADLFRKEGNTKEALLELGKAASLDPQNAAIQEEISKIRQTAADK